MGLLGLRRGVRSDCSKWLTTVFLTVASTPSSMGRRGVAACLHRACGRTFGGITGFDYHLRWLDSPPWVECLNPADLGLSEVNGVWVRPAPKVNTPEWGHRPKSATPVSEERHCG
jgi:hypothetical protein